MVAQLWARRLKNRPTRSTKRKTAVAESVPDEVQERIQPGRRRLHPHPLRPLPLHQSGHCFTLDRIGEKSAQALLDQIEKSKRAGLARVLFGLGIRFVGERTAQLLAAHFGSMDALQMAPAEELEQVNEVGPSVAQAIVEFFAEPHNRKLIARTQSRADSP